MNGASQHACEVQLGENHYPCFLQEQDRTLNHRQIKVLNFTPKLWKHRLIEISQLLNMYICKRFYMYMQVTWVQYQTKPFFPQGHIMSLIRVRKRLDVLSLPVQCFKCRTIHPPWKTEINREVDISQWGLILLRGSCGLLWFIFFLFFFYFLTSSFQLNCSPSS